MHVSLKRTSEKKGLLPGSLVHVGTRKTEKVIITMIDYDETKYEERQIERIEECLPCDISTIAPWYRGLLKKRGYKELAEKVNALAEGEPTNLEIAEVLDEVRESVKDDEDTKKELLTYDCMMQTYEEES